MDLRHCAIECWPPSPLTIHFDKSYRQYADDDLESLFEKGNNWLITIRMQGSHLDSHKSEIITKEVCETTTWAIYGSNAIEGVGLGWVITSHLCRKFFSGETLEEAANTKDLGQILAHHREQQPDLENASVHHISRGRTEIIQHTKAFQHILNAFVIEKRDLTENLIRETHKILTEGVPVIQKDMPDVQPEEYGGIYRTIPVAAGSTNFTVPRFVPAKMEEMCEELRQELAAADAQGSIDPFSVAAKYSLAFVQIHPFLDGNGRTCRMILNAILCRYAGIIVPIGEQVEERKEYLDIKKRASQEMEGYGEYATFVLRRATTRLRELKKKLTGKTVLQG